MQCRRPDALYGIIDEDYDDTCMPSSPPRIGNVGERGECIPCLHATLFRPPIPFFIVFFFLPIKHTNNNTSRLCFLLGHLFLSQTHTHTYTYIWKPELTLYDVSWSSGFVFKEYGSLRGEIPWRRRIESKYM